MYKPVNMAEFVGPSVIKEGDTANTLQVRLMDKKGVPKDLSAATVTWSLASYVGRLTSDRPATILSDGIVEIGFNSTDAVGFGSLLLQFNVTIGGTVEKFPADSQLVIRVTRSHENLIHAPVTFASLSVVEARLQSQYDEFVGSVVEGAPGVGLTYTWSGTQLGVKREDEQSYTFVNLKGSKGDPGERGEIGPPGERGEAGTGIEIKGSLSNTGELPPSGNNISDAYLINGILYIWDGTAWDNAGTIQGPQGEQGIQGIPGVAGKNLEYSWNGYQLGVRQQGETAYSFVNLRGATGPTGNTGLTGQTGAPGSDGKNLEFNWNGTQLGVRQQGSATYNYVNLKGTTGDTGAPGSDGKNLEFNWSGTQLGVRVAGTTTYSYVDLKGDPGEGGGAGDLYYILVTDYAHLVADGKWTAAITAALADLPTGGTLVFPEGDYPTASITVNKKCLITGTGKLIYDFTDAPSNIGVLHVTAAEVKIELLNFAGIGVFGGFDYKPYIRSSAMGTIVDSCRFVGGMQGVLYVSGSERSKITNCIADTCEQSGFILMGTQNCTVIGNTAITCGDGALSLFNAQNCIVTGNQVHWSDQSITIDAGSVGNTISANQIYGNKDGDTSYTGYYGIDLKNNSHSNTVIGNAVQGCVVGISIRFGDANDGGHLQNPSSNNIVIGNTITECHDKGFATNPSGILFQTQYGLTIANNVISRVDGVQIRGIGDGDFNDNVNISGNLMTLHGHNFGLMPYMAVDYPAIEIEGWEGVSIFNNTIQCAPETMTVALIKLTNCTFKAHGNVMKGVTYTGFEVLGTASGSIENNTMETRNLISSFAVLNSTGRTVINHNTHIGADLWDFISGGTSPFSAEGNLFNSNRAEAISGTGPRRLFNNENTLGGFSGGEMRYQDGRLEIYTGGAWSDAGLEGPPGADGVPGSDGADGLDGKDLEFTWNGYTLGVRRVGETTYTYSQSLRGAQGIQGQTGAPGADGADANLLIEQRASDPASPAPGQVWMRTDL